jgi:hypothetical protein
VLFDVWKQTRVILIRPGGPRRIVDHRLYHLEQPGPQGAVQGFPHPVIDFPVDPFLKVFFCPENVLKEWQHLVEEMGAQEIGVLDDSANIQVDRLEKIADLLIENNLNHVPWIFVNGIRANLATEEFMGKLNKSGIEINRKVLADLAMNDPKAFEAIVKKVQ